MGIQTDFAVLVDNSILTSYQNNTNFIILRVFIRYSDIDQIKSVIRVFRSKNKSKAIAVVCYNSTTHQVVIQFDVPNRSDLMCKHNESSYKWVSKSGVLTKIQIPQSTFMHSGNCGSYCVNGVLDVSKYSIDHVINALYTYADMRDAVIMGHLDSLTHSLTD